MWDEITFPFPDFNGTAVEVWEWERQRYPIAGPMLPRTGAIIGSCLKHNSGNYCWRHPVNSMGLNGSLRWLYCEDQVVFILPFDYKNGLSRLTLKIKDRQHHDFVVTDGTITSYSHNLRWLQWQQIHQVDNLLFSVNSLAIQFLFEWESDRWHDLAHTTLLRLWFHNALNKNFRSSCKRDTMGGVTALIGFYILPNLNKKYHDFHSTKWISNCRLLNDGNFFGP